MKQIGHTIEPWNKQKPRELQEMKCLLEFIYIKKGNELKDNKNGRNYAKN
jgi:hypothetical protein